MSGVWRGGDRALLKRIIACRWAKRATKQAVFCPPREMFSRAFFCRMPGRAWAPIPGYQLKKAHSNAVGFGGGVAIHLHWHSQRTRKVETFVTVANVVLSSQNSASKSTPRCSFALRLSPSCPRQPWVSRLRRGRNSLPLCLSILFAPGCPWPVHRRATGNPIRAPPPRGLLMAAALAAAARRISRNAWALCFKCR